MRVIAGRLGGRSFDSPNNTRTHPMSERARGGLFNTLGDIEGLTVLDAFAGSGALSFEAISRGAKHVTAIELDKKARDTIMANMIKLDLTASMKSIKANSGVWSEDHPNETYDIVIAAPPYDDVQLPVVEKLVKHVVNGGLFVLDWPRHQQPPELSGLKLVAQNNYSNAQLVFYR